MRLVTFVLLLIGAPVALRATVSPPAIDRLHISNSQFAQSDGRPFAWRGITAFRLLDFVAHGREADAERFLAWAHAQGLTIARVFAMGNGVLKLSPAEAQAALPRLLNVAARHDMYIEVVALVDTRAVPVDIADHVRTLGKIIAEHPNAVLEVANEPVHPTQSDAVHKADVLADARKAVPRDVLVSLGAVERGDGFAGADYVTWHVPRRDDREGWGHVLAIAEGDALVMRWKKPVISDEPIGAGPRYEPGRRDDSPGRFRAAAMVTRLAGLGATFHYDAGLATRIPDGLELECFQAWNSAWTLLPPDVEQRGTFYRADSAKTALATFHTRAALALFERHANDTAWVLAIRPEPSFSPPLRPGWEVVHRQRFEGASLLTARRTR